MTVAAVGVLAVGLAKEWAALARYAPSTMSYQRPTGESQTDHSIASGQYAHH